MVLRRSQSLPDWFHLAAAFEGRFAIADPAHVPLGIYGKQALETLGWWEPLRGRIFTAVDARATVLRVARGDCPLGIAYASDVHGVAEVVSVASIPSRSHVPIRYPIAILKTSPNRRAARLFMDFVTSLEAQSVLADHGFQPPPVGVVVAQPSSELSRKSSSTSTLRGRNRQRAGIQSTNVLPLLLDERGLLRKLRRPSP